MRTLPSFMQIDYNHPRARAPRAGQVKCDVSPVHSPLIPGSPGDRCCRVSLCEQVPGVGTVGRAAADLGVKQCPVPLRKVFEMVIFHVAFGLLIQEVPFNFQ